MQTSTPMTREQAEDAVSNGEAFLDKADPGWWREDTGNAIDLDALDMSSPGACILGQRCPLETAIISRYSAYRDHLSHLTGMQAEAWAILHGFNAPLEHFAADYQLLKQVWIERITARRDAHTGGDR